MFQYERTCVDELFNILDLLFLYFTLKNPSSSCFWYRSSDIMSKRSSLSFPLTLSS